VTAVHSCTKKSKKSKQIFCIPVVSTNFCGIQWNCVQNEREMCGVGSWSAFLALLDLVLGEITTLMLSILNTPFAAFCTAVAPVGVTMGSIFSLIPVKKPFVDRSFVEEASSRPYHATVLTALRASPINGTDEMNEFADQAIFLLGLGWPVGC
jgi:hypothetical protein